MIFGGFRKVFPSLENFEVNHTIHQQTLSLSIVQAYTSCESHSGKDCSDLGQFEVNHTIHLKVLFFTGLVHSAFAQAS